jgi:hypothetical protein
MGARVSIELLPSLPVYIILSRTDTRDQWRWTLRHAFAAVLGAASMQNSSNQGKSVYNLWLVCEAFPFWPMFLFSAGKRGNAHAQS